MSFDATAALDDLERRTTERLAALTGDYAGIVEASRDSNADDEHDPEGSTIAFERSQIGTLVEDARHHLAEITAARERLAEGTYGTCEGCQVKIPMARLSALPYSTLCIKCQREFERDGSVGDYTGEADYGRMAEHGNMDEREVRIADLEIDLSR